MNAGPGAEDSSALEELTLAQLCGRLLRQPWRTLSALRQVLAASPADALPAAPVMSPAMAPAAAPARSRRAPAGRSLALRLLALAAALWGNHALAASAWRGGSGLPAREALLLLLAFALWLWADALYAWPRRLGQERSLPPAARTVAGPAGRGPRLLAALAGAFCCWLAWRFTAHNRFTLVGLCAWLASVALWYRALTPGKPDLRAWWRALRVQLQRINWCGGYAPALLLILLLAAGLRLTRLDTVMPEMTSDHVEKIRDAWRVSQGDFHVFFANNGGREPLQMYAMALLARLPGMGFNFYTLKFLSALEGIVAVLLLAWTGRALIGGRQGRLVGLLAAALAAIGYWHVLLSRMGLRIVLTTAVTAVLLLLLWRALRHNRRGDFLAAGLVTGMGLYTYQAARMLPLVVLAGVALAMLWRAGGQRLLLLRNFAALTLMALVVAVPLGGYALEFPQDFWRRSTSRILGDGAIRADVTPGTGEHLAALTAGPRQLLENLGDALLMFNHRGDIAWINGAPGKPALDPWSGALFILGLAAWARLVRRRRSALALLLPLALLIMLLPSALALAYPIENPSHTRASGALPAVYLLAALPLAQLAGLLRHWLRGRTGRLCAAGLILLLLTGALRAGHQRYFVENLHAWQQATFPYSLAGQVLAAFVALSDAPGNAFVIAWPHWWDHRAVGLEAGLQEWPNGVLHSGELPAFLGRALTRAGEYRLDPERGLLFFVAPADEEALARLRAWFPRGQLQRRRSETARDDFLVYRVPPPGEAALRQLVTAVG